MDRSTAKQAIQSIVNFLRDELSGGNLESESAESVEVAVQCLETAYSLPCETEPILSLSHVYREALSNSDIMEIQPPLQSSISRASVSEEDKLEAENLKTQGNDFMGKDMFEVSAECYTKAIEKDPSNAVYYCNRAAAYSKLSKHAMAVNDCKKALEIQPQYSKAYGRMGLAYSSMSQHQQAKECYHKALNLEPGNEGFARNLAIAEQSIGSSTSQQPANPLAGLLNAAGGLGSLGNAFGNTGGAAPDLGSIMANPNLMNMATQLMSDPNMQNMMANIIGGNSANPVSPLQPPPSAAAPPPPPPAAAPIVPPPADGAAAPPPGGAGIEALFSAGRQLAEQMQNQHPDLLAQIRAQMQNGDQNNDQQPPSQS